jgi:hypothetical protein
MQRFSKTRSPLIQREKIEVQNGRPATSGLTKVLKGSLLAAHLFGLVEI